MTTETASPFFSAEELATIERAIAHRRSLGLSRLKEDLVDKAIIEKMLEAANWGQSNGDTEPWRFGVFSGEGRTALADAFEQAYNADYAEKEADPIAMQGYRDRAFQAPLWISIGMNPAVDEDAIVEEEMMAVATAVQNLHLVASAYGLVGMWHSKGTSTHPAVADALGLTPPSQLLGLFFCGWPNVDWPAGERKPLEEKVTWHLD